MHMTQAHVPSSFCIRDSPCVRFTGHATARYLPGASACCAFGNRLVGTLSELWGFELGLAVVL